MSILKFFGFSAAATGALLVQFALVSAVILPTHEGWSEASRKGLGEFIQASLALTVLGAAGGAVGASQRS